MTVGDSSEEEDLAASLANTIECVDPIERCSMVVQSYLGHIQETPYTKKIIESLGDFFEQAVSKASSLQARVETLSRSWGQTPGPTTANVEFHNEFAEQQAAAAEKDSRELQQVASKVLDASYFQSTGGASAKNGEGHVDQPSDSDLGESNSSRAQ